MRGYHVDGCERVSLFNPVVYLISGPRWALYGVADAHIVASTGMTLVFLAVGLGGCGAEPARLNRR